jgi:hypothetical protein
MRLMEGTEQELKEPKTKNGTSTRLVNCKEKKKRCGECIDK